MGNSLFMPLRRRIQAFAPETEFTIVVFGAFGYFCLGSVLMALFPSSSPPISEAHLDLLLIYETIVLSLLGTMLYWRGWTLERIGLRLTKKDTLVGIGLAFAAYLTYLAVWGLVEATGSHPRYPGNITEIASHGLKLGSVVAVSILNPIYEESFLCGYLLTDANENKHIVAGFNVSLAIRLTYHLYQGTAGVLGIIPVGAVFALWYVRSRRLWPVIVAHAVFDALGLLRFVGPA